MYFHHYYYCCMIILLLLSINLQYNEKLDHKKATATPKHLQRARTWQFLHDIIRTSPAHALQLYHSMEFHCALSCISLDSMKCHWQKIRTTRIKNNEIEGWSRDDQVKKYTNKICRRDNHLHHTSLRLIFEPPWFNKNIMRCLINSKATPPAHIDIKLDFRLWSWVGSTEPSQ